MQNNNSHNEHQHHLPAPQNIELFVQGENVANIELITLPSEARVRDIVEAMKAKGLAHHGDNETIIVLLEDDEHELVLDARLHDLGVRHRQRLHCHRCHRVHVGVTFNGIEKMHSFPTSATVGRVKGWADEKFELEGVDAVEQELQVCGTTTRPTEDMHIGTLVHHPHCDLRFTLAPKERVQG